MKKAKEWTPSKGVGWKPPTQADVSSLPKPTKNQKGHTTKCNIPF